MDLTNNIVANIIQIHSLDIFALTTTFVWYWFFTHDNEHDNSC